MPTLPSSQPSSQPSDSLRGELLLVLVTIMAAVGWLLSKKALETVDPFWFIGVRFLLAGLLLAFTCYPSLRKMSRTQWQTAALTGILFGLAMLLWVQGLFYSSHVGEAAFIASLSVIMIPVVGRIVFGDRIAPTLLVPMLMALVGLALLTLKGDFHLEKSQLFILASAMLFAVQFVLTSRYVAHIAPLGLAAVQMCTVGVIALSVAMVVSTARGQAFSLDWGWIAWGWVLASCVFSSLIRFGLQIYAMKLSSANNAGMIMVLEPVWTTLLGMLFFHEIMALNQWLGCGLILAAIVVFQLSRWRRQR